MKLHDFSEQRGRFLKLGCGWAELNRSQSDTLRHPAATGDLSKDSIASKHFVAHKRQER
jgi:hypothetical protein